MSQTLGAFLVVLAPQSGGHMKQIELACANCGTTFNKAKKEYDRQVRNGRKPDRFFCSRSCAVYAEMSVDPGRYTASLKPQKGNQHNRKGVFTYYLRKARQRHKDRWDETNLDEEYLQQLWDHQGGRCAWTGTEMVPVIKGQVVDYFASASLDRICSDIGYVKGNVQFVLLPLNHAKGNADEDDFRQFLQSINVSLRG